MSTEIPEREDIEVHIRENLRIEPSNMRALASEIEVLASILPPFPEQEKPQQCKLTTIIVRPSRSEDLWLYEVRYRSLDEGKTGLLAAREILEYSRSMVQKYL